jgi:hypothetical protein
MLRTACKIRSKIDLQNNSFPAGATRFGTASSRVAGSGFWPRGTAAFLAACRGCHPKYVHTLAIYIAACTEAQVLCQRGQRDLSSGIAYARLFEPTLLRLMEQRFVFGAISFHFLLLFLQAPFQNSIRHNSLSLLLALIY